MDNNYMTTQKATLFVSVITSLLTTFTGSAITLSIPDISVEFSVSAVSIGWIVTIYTLVVAAFAVPFGRIADLTCRKKVLVIGLIVFTIGAVAAIFSDSMKFIMIARGMQAFGASMIFATNQAILISEFGESERGRVLGYSTAATYIGLSAGPVLGGIINNHFGWRAIFIVSALIAIVSLILALAKLPKRDSVLAKEHLDMAGLVLYSLTIIFVVYSLSEFTRNAYNLILFPIGIILGAMFLAREISTESPLVDVKIFMNSRKYTISNLMALTNYAATFAISYLLSIYLQVVQGYDSQTAGLMLIAAPFVQALVSPYAGNLSDKIQPFKLATRGMALCAVALFMFSFLSVNTNMFYVMATLVLSGIGFALFSSPNTNAVMSCVNKTQYSVASSMLSTMRSLGQSISMVIVTIVVSMNMGRMALADAGPALLSNTLRETFAVFTILCLLGVIMSNMRGKSRTDCDAAE